MKRLTVVVSALGLGLLVAWLFGYVTSRLEWPRSLQTPQRCYEIDHCDTPWWLMAVFVSWLFGPAILYGGVAYVGIGRRWPLTQWLAAFVFLSIATGALYAAWYIYRAFG